MAIPIDLIIVILFFLTIFIIGFLERKKVTLEDYWVNSRKTNKFILIATVASTFLGVGTILSNAGIAFSGGGIATLVLMSSFFVYFLVYAKFFAPKVKEFGDKHKAYTVPDFLGIRYSNKVRGVSLIVILITYSMFLSLQILGMGIFVSAVGGMDPVLATILGGVIVIAYTTVGGLRADIRTDVFQFIIMILLLTLFLPLVIIKSGGFSIISSLPYSFLSGQEFAPWYVLVFGFLFIGATNLVASDIWQRTYAGDSKKNVKWAMNIVGIIVLLFMLMGVLFGVYGKVIVPGADANTVVPELLRNFAPPIFFGVIVAAFFAAIMSSSDTMLLLVSMTLVHDLYQKTLGHKLTPESTLRISRWVTLFVGVISLAVAIIIFSIVHIAIESISFLVVLIPAVIFGFYGKKATSKAAFWSIIIGTLTIIAFLFIDPVQAFIPGLIISFLVFFIVNKFAKD
jgi:SSS family solute:Na+ symporter